MVAAGALWRPHRGVYADARARIAPRGHLFAALLTVTPGAFLSHRTAAAIYGLRPPSVSAIELTVIAEHTPGRQRLRVHRVSHAPPVDEVRMRDGLRVSSMARMLVELAPRESPSELSRLITEAARRGLLHPDRMQPLLVRYARRPGVSALREALTSVHPTPRDKSGFERAFRDWLATHPEIPPAQRNVRLGPWELDSYWPQPRVVVETDGDRYHMLPADLERDRIKDTWLQRHGIRVMRVTEFRFEHDRTGVLDDLAALLGVQRAA